MGVSTRYLPGYVKMQENEAIGKINKLWNTNLDNIFKPVNLATKMMSEEIKALLIFGEDPLFVSENYKFFNGLEFILVQDMFATATTKEADVILPQTSIIEQNGTYTTCDRRIQRAMQIINPKMNVYNWQIITALGKNFIDDFNYKSAEEIFNEIGKVNRLYSNKKYGEYWDDKCSKGKYLTGDQKACFSIFNTDVTTIPPEKPDIISSENYYRKKIRL